MQRVGTLIKKLQEQLDANIAISKMVLTAQMLQAQLAHLQNMQNVQEEETLAAVQIPQTILPQLPSDEEEKTITVLQVNEAEIEAELEEIKRNAEAIAKISVQNKPQIILDIAEQEIPTLTTHLQNQSTTLLNELNETIVSKTSSIHDNLKQNDNDISSSHLENQIKDLKKAIDINDKFLFINELFRGDEIMYERSIKTINSFNILPEAEYWIQRELKTKLGWNENNEAVKQFTQLVKKRFA